MDIKDIENKYYKKDMRKFKHRFFKKNLMLIPHFSSSKRKIERSVKLKFR